MSQDVQSMQEEDPRTTEGEEPNEDQVEQEGGAQDAEATEGSGPQETGRDENIEAAEDSEDTEDKEDSDEAPLSKIEQLRNLEPIRLVEAALFTAGRPVGVDELAEATGLSMDVVKQAARSLEQEYEERGDATALEVHLAGAKWAMQLKTIYVQHAQTLARMEIPKKTLKTLALIAFHQPMLQSELVDMIGSKTYEHVRELQEIGLVKTRPDGLSKRLTTSPEFPEYFGIPATDTHEIRAYLAKKVGLSLSELKGKAELGDFDENAPASEAEVEAAAREKEIRPDEEAEQAEPAEQAEHGATSEMDGHDEGTEGSEAADRSQEEGLQGAEPASDTAQEVQQPDGTADATASA